MSGQVTIEKQLRVAAPGVPSFLADSPKILWDHYKKEMNRRRKLDEGT